MQGQYINVPSRRYLRTRGLEYNLQGSLTNIVSTSNDWGLVHRDTSLSVPVFMRAPNPPEPGKKYFSIVAGLKHVFSRGSILPYYFGRYKCATRPQPMNDGKLQTPPALSSLPLFHGSMTTLQMSCVAIFNTTAAFFQGKNDFKAQPTEETLHRYGYLRQTWRVHECLNWKVTQFHDDPVVPDTNQPLHAQPSQEAFFEVLTTREHGNPSNVLSVYLTFNAHGDMELP
ncbi:hypothetical protein BYT27DRAFT_7258730 [Phlegmacium glaucopus]|nr:hypothetical protein BYT27DRAFT_7258730 [Phlegmacium glaucopus]